MPKKAPLQMTWTHKEQDWIFHHDRRPQDGGMLYGFMRAGRRAVAELHPEWPYTREQMMKFRLRNEEPWVSDSELDRLFRDELRRRGFDPDTFKITCKRPKVSTPGNEKNASHK